MAFLLRPKSLHQRTGLCPSASQFLQPKPAQSAKRRTRTPSGIVLEFLEVDAASVATTSPAQFTKGAPESPPGMLWSRSRWMPRLSPQPRQRSPPRGAPEPHQGSFWNFSRWTPRLSPQPCQRSSPKARRSPHQGCSGVAQGGRRVGRYNLASAVHQRRAGVPTRDALESLKVDAAPVATIASAVRQEAHRNPTRDRSGIPRSGHRASRQRSSPGARRNSLRRLWSRSRWTPRQQQPVLQPPGFWEAGLNVQRLGLADFKLANVKLGGRTDKLDAIRNTHSASS